MSYICNDNVSVDSLARANSKLIGSRGDLPDPVIATPVYAESKIFNKLNRSTNGYNGVLAGQARCGGEEQGRDTIINQWVCGNQLPFSEEDDEVHRYDDKPWLYDQPVSRRGAQVLNPQCGEGQPQAYLDPATGEIVFRPTEPVCPPALNPLGAILIHEQPTRNKVDLCGPRAYGQESLACWKKQVEQDWTDRSIEMREDRMYSTMCRRAHEAAERHRYPSYTYNTRGAF